MESGVKVLGGRSASVRPFQVLDNFGNHLGLGNESKDTKTSAAIAKERVGLENSLNQICPSFSESFSGFLRKLGLMGFCVALVGRFGFNFEVVLFSQSRRPGGIEAIVMAVMFSRLWDLYDDASDKFEDIEGLPVGMVEQTQLGVVVRGFALVKKGAWVPFMRRPSFSLLRRLIRMRRRIISVVRSSISGRLRNAPPMDATLEYASHERVPDGEHSYVST